MIENSYVVIESDGERVTVNYWEDGDVREGPATFPARYASFAGIVTYAETQLNSHYLNLKQREEIQELLGAYWSKGTLRFDWKDCPERGTATGEGKSHAM